MHVAYLRSLRRQIAARGGATEADWGCPIRYRVARRIEAILNEVCWCDPSLTFVPDDPLAVVGEWESGDLSELQAWWDIMKCFGIDANMESAEALWHARSPTFGELVDFVIQHSRDAEAIVRSGTPDMCRR